MKVVLRLSDPWEMGEALGWAPIDATVINSSGETWLVTIDQPFDYQDMEFKFVIVSPRHEGKPLCQVDVETIPCNMIVTTSERAVSADPCDVSWWRGGNAMIGTIEIGNLATPTI